MDRSVCNRNCWIAGAIAGVVVLLFTAGIGGMGWAGGLFLGLITFALFGSLMVWLVCNTRPELVPEADGMTGTDWERQVVDHQPETLLVSAPPLGPEAYSAPSQMPIVAGAMPQAAATPHEAQAKAEPKAKPEPKPEAKPKAPEPKPAVTAAPAAEPAPATSPAPAADDLELIKGVGPKLTERLLENGITRFAQIAEWDEAAVAEYAPRIGRTSSRIAAEDWVGQARILAAGGETEHSRRIRRDEVDE